MQHKNPYSGFTLIELIIVIVILGILSIFLVPIVNSALISTRVSASVEILAQDIQTVRDLAGTKHDTLWIVFDSLNEKYTVYKGPSVATRSIMNHPNSHNEWIVSFDNATYKGVDITSETFGSNGLYFDAWGDAVVGGSIVLNNGEKTISITQLSGKVSIQ